MLGLAVVSTLLEMPFDWYATFRIEEKYGFNKMTGKTWGWDALKGFFLSLLIGGIILTAVVEVYRGTGDLFLVLCLGNHQFLFFVYGLILLSFDRASF